MGVLSSTYCPPCVNAQKSVMLSQGLSCDHKGRHVIMWSQGLLCDHRYIMWLQGLSCDNKVVMWSQGPSCDLISSIMLITIMHKFKLYLFFFSKFILLQRYDWTKCVKKIVFPPSCITAPMFYANRIPFSIHGRQSAYIIGVGWYHTKLHPHSKKQSTIWKFPWFP